MTESQRTWLIYANKNKCRHADAIHDLGFISWAMGSKYKFTIGDIVYVFMSDERKVRFKMRVEKQGIKREDSAYCIFLSPEDITYRLRFVAEYSGGLLDEDELRARGFKGGRSIEKPSCRQGEYMDYIKSVFDSIENTSPMPLDIADRSMMVVDMFSGRYINEFIGHEILNLEKNAKDGRYYGYCPPLDNIDITKLGASKNDDFIDGVTVIYVKKQRGTNNREVIAFCENAKVHRKCIIDKTLNRFLDKEKTHCSYSIESDTLVNLMYEESKFVIRINDYNNKMFRMQRFYKGTYPDLDKKLFDYIRNVLNKDVDDDLTFQSEIQDLDEKECLDIEDNSKKEPVFLGGQKSLSVNKSSAVSKQALMKAKYICKGNPEHKTFENAKGKTYMEGHHLIPCTYSNAQHYWKTKGINIDCQANIVCLCPTCHRLIHYGSADAKRDLLKRLYETQIPQLRNVGLDITLEELFGLYSIEIM